MQVFTAISSLLAETLLPAKASGTSCLSSWRASLSARSILDLLVWMLAGWAAFSREAKLEVGVSPGHLGHRGPGPWVCWDLSPPLLEPFLLPAHLLFPIALLHTHPSYSPFFCWLACFSEEVCEPKRTLYLLSLMPSGGQGEAVMLFSAPHFQISSYSPQHRNIPPSTPVHPAVAHSPGTFLSLSHFGFVAFICTVNRDEDLQPRRAVG